MNERLQKSTVITYHSYMYSSNSANINATADSSNENSREIRNWSLLLAQRILAKFSPEDDTILNTLAEN